MEGMIRTVIQDMPDPATTLSDSRQAMDNLLTTAQSDLESETQGRARLVDFGFVGGPATLVSTWQITFSFEGP